MLDGTANNKTRNAEIVMEERDKNIGNVENCDMLLFRHLIDGIKDYAIFMIKLDGVIGTWNPGVQRLIGYEEEEFVGKHFSILFFEEEKALGLAEGELHIASKEGKAEDERWHKKKNGEKFWASGLVTSIKNESEEVIGYAKIMRDKTEQKKFDDERSKTLNALALANKELANFAGVVSHDLKAPLNTVYGFANILKSKSIRDSEVQESISHIIDGTQRMLSLVGTVLEYSAAPGGGNLKELIDGNKVVMQVLTSLKASISESGALISVENLPQVWAEQVQLERVFQNLIENAIKYRTPGLKPEISISVELKDEVVIFSVEDNGIGIIKENIENVFTFFERADADSSVMGQGIGLATCRKIIENWNGRVWVESMREKGSIFYFSLPTQPPMEKDDSDLHTLAMNRESLVKTVNLRQ